MITTLATLLAIVFSSLALIHFNWAIGNQWGFDHALPTNENGEKILTPRKIDSFIVGIGLSLFGLFYFLKLGLIHCNLPNSILKYISWIIPAIFLLRAIGDFKYVGFFKKVNQTKFGKMDTKYYAPLCLSIALIGFLVAFFGKISTNS